MESPPGPELSDIIGNERREHTMKRRIAIWASAGFLVAGCWALYFLAATPPPMTSADPIMILVRLTCPITLFSSYPLSLYLVLLANAVTYMLSGLIVETARQQLHRADYAH